MSSVPAEEMRLFKRDEGPGILRKVALTRMAFIKISESVSFCYFSIFVKNKQKMN